jgi:hypothetical protein
MLPSDCIGRGCAAKELSAEIERLREDRDAFLAKLETADEDHERLRGAVERLITVIRNVHGNLLDNRIDAALAGDAAQPAADQPRACSYTNPCWADDCGACGSRSPTAVQPEPQSPEHP